MRLRVARKVLRQRYEGAEYRPATVADAYARLAIAQSLALRCWRAEGNGGVQVPTLENSRGTARNALPRRAD